jgi:1,2-phenylacetyl-CoA epoxidase PaaB subunit
VRREQAVAVWVGAKSKVKIPTPSTRSGQALSPKTRQGWGAQKKTEIFQLKQTIEKSEENGEDSLGDLAKQLEREISERKLRLKAVCGH